MIVHIVLKRTCQDYHGCSDEIVNVYADRESAEECVKKEEEENGCYQTDFWFDTYTVMRKKFKTKSK